MFHIPSGTICYLQECLIPIRQPDDFRFSPNWVEYYQGEHGREKRHLLMLKQISILYALTKN